MEPNIQPHVHKRVDYVHLTIRCMMNTLDNKVENTALVGRDYKHTYGSGIVLLCCRYNNVRLMRAIFAARNKCLQRAMYLNYRVCGDCTGTTMPPLHIMMRKAAKYGSLDIVHFIHNIHEFYGNETTVNNATYHYANGEILRFLVDNYVVTNTAMYNAISANDIEKVKIMSISKNANTFHDLSIEEFIVTANEYNCIEIRDYLSTLLIVGKGWGGSTNNN